MSDNVDDQEMNFAEGEAEAAAPAKAKGPGPGIARILMIVGIGLGAVIFIVTVVVITVGIVNKGGKPAATIETSEDYQAATPIFQYVDTIGEIRTRTADAEPSSVVVRIQLGLDLQDKDTGVELNQRMPQIRDYLRQYFTAKYAEDLAPDKEAIIKDDLKENLNRMLSKPTVREVLFGQLTVVKL
jgi:Flagellar basal body-associated protein